MIQKRGHLPRHIITDDGIKPGPTKLKTISKFPIPTKIKEIQAFIGPSRYYMKFIENFSKIAKSLTKLTKKEEPFEWIIKQQTAFNLLKNKFSNFSFRN